MDDVAIKLGIFDQRCFYNAFAEFDNQDIETSLKSENLIVKIFAVLDRRVGKRRLKIMKETIMDEPDTSPRVLCNSGKSRRDCYKFQFIELRKRNLRRCL